MGVPSLSPYLNTISFLACYLPYLFPMNYCSLGSLALLLISGCGIAIEASMCVSSADSSAIEESGGEEAGVGLALIYLEKVAVSFDISLCRSTSLIIL